MTKRLTVPEISDGYPVDWWALSRQQRMFLIEYITGFFAQGKYDAKSAARTAYPNVVDIKIWANRLLVNSRIKRILMLHQGYTEQEIVLAEVRSLIQKSKRKSANPSRLVMSWWKVAAALEAIAAKGNSHD